MQVPAWRALLMATAERASDFLERLPERPVGAGAGVDQLRAALGGPLPAGPQEPATVVANLVDTAEAGLVATPSGRFFGFVIGGALPAAVAADWLTSAWDQNAGLHVASPAGSVVEEVAAGWLTQLLGLPPGTSCGFVTGGQMANLTCLAAARHHVLAGAGWDVEVDGLVGAPPLRVLVGEERHDTIDRALRFLGVGTGRIVPVAADGQGRMRPDALAVALAAGDGPTIVCTQLGNVNTGALDPVGELTGVAHDRDAWVHVDGAFGLWAAASPRLRSTVAGVERADSWAADAHKWLNVPYDSGLAFTAHPASHRAAMGVHASYLVHAEGDERDQMDWNPEFSRRARGFSVYAALRSLGRDGVAAMVDRCCGHARRFAELLSDGSGVEILNEVVLNQVLVRFRSPDGDHDGLTRAVVGAVQREGTCWMSATTWHGQAAMRISVSNWSTDDDDVEHSVAAIRRCVALVTGT
ncbi:MAG TPA: pyridoxal-dependent decarboxylase [Nitriliruptorales bacterium]|nr:pyridoxal-dependent decarboxylase [Nitriliruptorales bacterium]